MHNITQKNQQFIIESPTASDFDSSIDVSNRILKALRFQFEEFSVFANKKSNNITFSMFVELFMEEETILGGITSTCEFIKDKLQSNNTFYTNQQGNKFTIIDAKVSTENDIINKFNLPKEEKTKNLYIETKPTNKEALAQFILR